ncbi:MAG: SLC13 family permease [Bacteroidetes bacterium]|jgi:Na+/H+ antiporter NhaD/arsenite permease-like protein|nr:SLC13 family permease [Bacteroidota bacterium]
MIPPFAVIVLAVVFVLIAVRQVGRVRIPIWIAMSGGALAVVALGSVSIPDAVRAVNMDVILFLFGMFVIGQALEESGYLSHLSYKFLKRAHSIDVLMLFILFGVGFGSAILMNDTLAIIGTPVMLLLAKKHEMSPKLLLLVLAFAVTIGSVMSPIGNPQNLLIALNGKIQDPFVEFFKWLFIPTVINLVAAFFLLKRSYPGDFHDTPLKHSQEPIHDKHLAFLAKISLQMVLILIGVKIATVILGSQWEFRLTYIALASCLPIFVGSPKRWRIVRHIDWSTLAFFAAMFVLMESVWRSGFFQQVLERYSTGAGSHPITSVESILTVSILLSQFISNVPLVALYQPMLLHGGATLEGFMALAAGSTIAGNMFILGAASNVIVIQNAEKRSHHTITFWEFSKIGIPLTIVNAVVYWVTFVIM